MCRITCMKRMVALSLLGCFLSFHQGAQGMHIKRTEVTKEIAVRCQVKPEEQNRDALLEKLFDLYTDAQVMHEKWNVVEASNIDKILNDEREGMCKGLVTLINTSIDERSKDQCNLAKELNELKGEVGEWTNNGDEGNKDTLKDLLALASQRLHLDESSPIKMYELYPNAKVMYQEWKIDEVSTPGLYNSRLDTCKELMELVSKDAKKCPCYYKAVNLNALHGRSMLWVNTIDESNKRLLGSILALIDCRFRKVSFADELSKYIILNYFGSEGSHLPILVSDVLEKIKQYDITPLKPGTEMQLIENRVNS